MSETAQFWRGPFGRDYTARNDGDEIIAANEQFFGTIFQANGSTAATWPRSVIEFGANRGLNIQALRRMDPTIELSAVEINPEAAAELRALGYVTVYEGDMLDPEERWGRHDLVLSKGLLIHVAPGDLETAYDVLYSASRRYILIAEYYNPVPVEVEYRGNAGRMWKRDFASEMMARFPDLTCFVYGFFWHRDTTAPQDDITAFLLEKAE